MASDYDSTSRVRRVVRRLVTHRLVASVSARLLPTFDQVAIRLGDGRWTVSGWLTDLPVVRLRTTGARSGRNRWSQVMAVPDGSDLLIAAANFGKQTHPSWYYNVRANPLVAIDDGSGPRAYTAIELQGRDRQQAFSRMLRYNPGWVRFREQSGSRGIPVFRLHPEGGTRGSP